MLEKINNDYLIEEEIKSIKNNKFLNDKIVEIYNNNHFNPFEDMKKHNEGVLKSIIEFAIFYNKWNKK